jgi:flagellar biosynthesis protein FliR
MKHQPKNIYISGIVTGSVMGIFTSFLSYAMVVNIAGDVLVGSSGRLFLQLMIASNVFIGAFVGMIVSLTVHSVVKKKHLS